jgi:hypothetical protein
MLRLADRWSPQVGIGNGEVLSAVRDRHPNFGQIPRVVAYKQALRFGEEMAQKGVPVPYMEHLKSGPPNLSRDGGEEI